MSVSGFDERTAVIDPPSADTTLASGFRIVAVRLASVPMLELRLCAPLAATDSAMAGRVAVLAATLFSGTAGRDRAGIAAFLAPAGATLGALASPERLNIVGRCLACGAQTLLDVVAEVMKGARHPAAEVARERARLAEEAIDARTRSHVIAREALQRRRYGSHPFGVEHPDSGDLASVAASDVRDLHRDALRARGSVLVLVGDIDPDRVTAGAAAAFEDWRGSAASTSLPPLPPIVGGDVLLVDRPAASLSHIRLSAEAVSRIDPLFPSVELANYAFGGYFSSRLVRTLREEQGMAYAATSDIELTPSRAVMLVATDTATVSTPAALQAIRSELSQFVDDPPSPREVDRARRYAVGSMLVATSSQAGLASALTGLAIRGLGLPWLRDHPLRIGAATVDEVAVAAARHFDPARYTGVVVGDAAALQAPLTAVGGVAT